MKEIKLTQNKLAQVDDADFKQQNSFGWFALKNYNTFYAARKSGKGALQKIILMHREIIDAPENVDVDHWDHDGLNNQRHNLRLASGSQNQANRRRNKNNKSGFRGVSWDAEHGKWLSTIKVNYKQKKLGRFVNILDAARAYDIAAIRFFGEFAVLNFPDKGEIKSE